MGSEMCIRDSCSRALRLYVAETRSCSGGRSFRSWLTTTSAAGSYIGPITNQGGTFGAVDCRFGDFFTKNTISEPLFAPRPS